MLPRDTEDAKDEAKGSKEKAKKEEPLEGPDDKEEKIKHKTNKRKKEGAEDNQEEDKEKESNNKVNEETARDKESEEAPKKRKKASQAKIAFSLLNPHVVVFSKNKVLP